MSSLSTPPEGDASRSLRARATEPNRSARFTHFEALILSRVRSRQLELPRASGRSSLGLQPLQSFLLPRLGSSDPPRPRGPEHGLPPKGRATTRRTSRPLASGETSWLREATSRPRRRSSGPLRDRPAPPLGGDSCSLDLGTPGEPFVPGLRSLAVRGKRRFSEEIACSLEVSCLVDSLVAVRSAQVRADRFTSWSSSRLRSPCHSLDL